MITVSKEFLNDFDFVMKYYNVTGQELEQEKQRVRDNFEVAKECYTSIAKALRSLTAFHKD